MEEWKKVRLGDCIKEINERTTENNQYEVLTSSKSGIYSQEEYFDKQVASKDNSGYKIIRKGQFTYRSMSDNGTFTINRLENKEIGIVSPAYPVFQAIDINATYLKYFFQSELFRKEIHTLSQGSTRIALKFKDLSDIELILLPQKEQEKIVIILTKVDMMINKYEKLINLKKKYLDDKMIEMFGVADNTEYPIKTLMEIIDVKDKNSLKRGPFGGSLKKADFINDGYLVYEQRHAIHSDFKYEKYYINEEKYKSMIGFRVNPKDLIVSCSGATLGRIAEIPEDAKEGIINQALLKIKLDSNMMNNAFFIRLFRGKEIQNKLLGFSRGTGMPNFPSMSEVKKLKFICPPIEKQEKFATISEIIERQIEKLEMQKENYIKLKQGLMQKLLTGKIRVKI